MEKGGEELRLGGGSQGKGKKGKKVEMGTKTSSSETGTHEWLQVRRGGPVKLEKLFLLAFKAQASTFQIAWCWGYRRGLL